MSKLHYETYNMTLNKGQKHKKFKNILFKEAYIHDKNPTALSDWVTTILIF